MCAHGGGATVLPATFGLRATMPCGEVLDRVRAQGFEITCRRAIARCRPGYFLLIARKVRR
jgi:hypothetical protein